MALHTQTKFAELCGVTPAKLSTYKSRKKVFVKEVGGVDMVDDADPVNRAFYEKWSAKAKDVEVPEQKKKVSKGAEVKIKPIAPGGEESEEEPIVQGVVLSERSPLTLIEKHQKLSVIEKNRAQTRLHEIDEQKKRGLLLPRDVTQASFIRFSESIKLAYKEGTERLLVVIAQKKGLTAEEQADLRTQLTKIINDSVKKGIERAKKDIKNISEETATVSKINEQNKPTEEQE